MLPWTSLSSEAAILCRTQQRFVATKVGTVECSLLGHPNRRRAFKGCLGFAYLFLSSTLARFSAVWRACGLGAAYTKYVGITRYQWRSRGHRRLLRERTETRCCHEVSEAHYRTLENSQDFNNAVMEEKTTGSIIAPHSIGWKESAHAKVPVASSGRRSLCERH